MTHTRVIVRNQSALQSALLSQSRIVTGVAQILMLAKAVLSVLSGVLVIFLHEVH